MDYKIKLDIFEGPLDLLLHLIKKNEVDIYDIPIALITGEYLESIEIIKDMTLDLAGEFLLMAATLVHIKSKMLLPPDVAETEEEEEGADPREELVRRLLEYQRYREAARELSEKEILGRDVFSRGPNVSLEGLDEEKGFARGSCLPPPFPPRRGAGASCSLCGRALPPSTGTRPRGRGSCPLLSRCTRGALP